MSVRHTFPRRPEERQWSGGKQVAGPTQSATFRALEIKEPSQYCWAHLKFRFLKTSVRWIDLMNHQNPAMTSTTILPKTSPFLYRSKPLLTSRTGKVESIATSAPSLSHVARSSRSLLLDFTYTQFAAFDDKRLPNLSAANAIDGNVVT